MLAPDEFKCFQKTTPQTLTKWSPPKCYLHSKETLAKVCRFKWEKLPLLLSWYDQAYFKLLVLVKVDSLMIVIVNFTAKVLLFFNVIFQFLNPSYLII